MTIPMSSADWYRRCLGPYRWLLPRIAWKGLWFVCCHMWGSSTSGKACCFGAWPGGLGFESGYGPQESQSLSFSGIRSESKPPLGPKPTSQTISWVLWCSSVGISFGTWRWTVEGKIRTLNPLWESDFYMCQGLNSLCRGWSSHL